jgi:excisionase family DNA binding protein
LSVRTSAPDPNKLSYSIAEATRAIGIGRSKLFQELAVGRLKAVKLGSRTLITHDELARYLDDLPAARTSKGTT